MSAKCYIANAYEGGLVSRVAVAPRGAYEGVTGRLLKVTYLQARLAMSECAAIGSLHISLEHVMAVVLWLWHIDVKPHI